MDVVIANPPFGKKQDNNKTALKFFVNEIDAKAACSLKKEFSSPQKKPFVTHFVAQAVFFDFNSQKTPEFLLKMS